jgi:Raf kinase inhibitor-like YbhB/YbcL family protein
MPLNIRDLAISSPDIPAFSTISTTYVVDGDNKTPTIDIAGVPSDAVELAVIMHDPDAPLPHGFTHWTLYNIPASTTRIDAANVASFTTGPNTMGEAAWTGPQPPPGHGQHHYYFWVYALDTPVTKPVSREEFLSAYAGNILEQNRFVAHFSTAR